ncbi:TPA: hypothetical protein ACN36H_003135 [Vibrio parahaemolyticus]
MATTVLLVHGIGSHKKGSMKSAFIASVNDTVKNHFKLNYDIGQDQCLKIEEFNYSQDFDAARRKMAEAVQIGNSSGLDLLDGVSVNLIDEIIEFLSDVDKEGFLYEYFLDIIIYGSTHKGPETRTKLKHKVNQLVNEQGKLVIVTHSMGTAVVHDSLNSLYTQNPGLNTVKGLITFANVSRMIPIVSGLPDPSEGCVHMDLEKGGCIRDLFINSYNNLDPITFFKPFHKTHTYDVQHIEQKIQKVVNPHSFAQYAAHPKFVTEFLNNFGCGPDIDYEDDLPTAMSSYKQGSISHRFDNVKEKLDELTDNDANLKEFITFVKEVSKTYKELKKLSDEINL